MAGNSQKAPPLLPKEAAPFADTNPAANPAEAQPAIAPGRKILVVDDNPVVLKAFELKLVSLGFTVLTATDGAEAANLANDERPDLIVLDINFPPPAGSGGLQWNGFSIMTWMRRFKEAADIPVIIITGSDPEKFRERALAAGAAAFFSKPIDTGEFVAAIHRILGESGAKA